MVAIQASSGVNHEGEVAVKEALIRILADGKFYSGAALGERLGVSRSAIWKHIQALADYQLDVHAVSGKGYRLSHTQYYKLYISSTNECTRRFA